MKSRLARSVVVLGLAGGLFASSALPQTSTPIKVSDAIEGGRPGVSVARCGTTIVKLFLHINRDEQRLRLQARYNDPAKRWKFSAGE